MVHPSMLEFCGNLFVVYLHLRGAVRIEFHDTGNPGCWKYVILFHFCGIYSSEPGHQ